MPEREIPTIAYPEALPITGKREEILRLLQKEPVVIVAGETGSGKTTQLPKMCLEAGLAQAGAILCTQPRRVAALSVSRRIAEELKVTWGHFVGAKIRFTDQTRRDTKIKVMTDGMLLADLQQDPWLRQASVVIIDEAHERSLNIDFLLGSLKLLLQKRKNLKLVVTSATIDTQRFSEAFDGAPVVEVSGRMYPVETVWAPLEEMGEEYTYIDGAVEAVERIVHWNRPGDILVFLPGEKDIRETMSLLEDRGMGRLRLLPLFGRLTSGEQEAIFQSSPQRKVILSTNIAETSLTIPGIRFVVDSGLARISRFSPHSRTRRLPIEPIPKSSAEQRKGRAGRLEDGICIRLYSEDDYNLREDFAAPEILRSNLADVILRMKAFRIGEMENFPFLEPPNERAIRAGYTQLIELGALKEDNELTETGRRMARLPVDPAVARMILEAEKEGCLREILIIAAGLSIQDPRERPMEAVKEADAMHRGFSHAESDFLTLLNIWDAFHDKLEKLTQRKVRKFCKDHFLSYQRMREWRDIHAQLERVLKDLRIERINRLPAEYEQIHRALLSGLLNGIGRWEEGNEYTVAHNRKVRIFPGSALFRREVARKRAKKEVKEAERKAKRKAPAWILSAEYVETSQRFARTNARIEVEWIRRVGDHLIRRRYSDPVYQEKGERVVVKERQLLNGLELAAPFVGYARIQPVAATEIYIREALVAGRVQRKPDFMEHNDALREGLEERRTRMRLGGVWAISERLFEFYSSRLENVGSTADLNRFVKESHGGKRGFLFATEEDLLEEKEELDLEAFPDRLEANGIRIQLDYNYKPGEAEDGATLRVPVEEFERVAPGMLDWAVPGYLRERVEQMLRGLPKEIRIQLMPIGDLVESIVPALVPGRETLVDQVASLIARERRQRIDPRLLESVEVAGHLRPRIELVDQNRQTIASGRDWQKVADQYREATRRDFEQGKGRDRLTLWKQACREMEKEDLRDWDLPDFEREKQLGTVAGLPLVAYPGLECIGQKVNLRLYPNADEAAAATPDGFFQLCIHSLGRDLGWLEKDLRKEVQRVALSYGHLMDLNGLRKQLMFLACRYFFDCPEPLPLRRTTFERVCTQARERSRGFAPKLVDLLDSIARQRDLLLGKTGRAPFVVAEVEALIGRNFLLHADYEHLQRYPRYLKAVEIRWERARLNPQKDAEKARPLIDFIQKLNQSGLTGPDRKRIRWMLEEFKVQCFAQELATAGKVSARKLELTLKEAIGKAGK